ncbi:hypothetical protein [Methanolacinia paynteri]|uniref:hypothetical protein n=1 Tax=Methanolacinia paynteri TaxID=230356 RepID=UPI00064F8331|nr:hypothetical protein [Methanolacinia paynteri]
MESFICHPLSGNGSQIYVRLTEQHYYVDWGSTPLAFPKILIDDIRDNFFKTSDWYPLGAKWDDPIEGGLGEYIQKYQTISSLHSPKYASMIASIMFHLKMVEYRRNKNQHNRIELKKK